MLYARMPAADIAPAAYCFKSRELRESPPPLLAAQPVRSCGKV